MSTKFEPVEMGGMPWTQDKPVSDGLFWCISQKAWDVGEAPSVALIRVIDVRRDGMLIGMEYDFDDNEFSDIGPIEDGGHDASLWHRIETPEIGTEEFWKAWKDPLLERT